MSAAERELRTAGEATLEVSLDLPLPKTIRVGERTAVFCAGTCFHTVRPIEELTIVAGGRRHRPTAQAMPRPDRFRSLRSALSSDPAASLRGDPKALRAAEHRSYRSGFWATIPIEAPQRPGEVKLHAEARLGGGATARAALGTIAVRERPQPPCYDGVPATGQALIAICMATFNPEIDLFRAQVESIRAQTDRDWICLISDDRSRPDRFRAISETVAGDPRFFLSRSEEHLGFYRNFERALEMVPPQADLIALSDHDDRWYPDKLAVLRAAIGDAELAYSDQRLVDAQGRVRRETLWRGRRNNHTNLASLLIANTIVGAASLLRRRVLDHAVPFPDGPGWQFHDHWLGLVAMALGDVVFVDRPLYDYVQHPRAVLGRTTSRPEPSRSDGRRLPRPRLAPWHDTFDRWRASYFGAYLDRELQARVLLARCETALTPRKRRTLRRFIDADRSALALAWLVARPARGLFGRNETLRSEQVLVRGIVWRHLVSLRARGRTGPGGSTQDASLPRIDPKSVGSKRLRRWIAQA